MEKFVWFIVQMDRFVRGDRKFHRTDRQRFSYAIVWVTSFRQENPMIILGYR